MQIALSFGWRIMSGDITAAFLRGDPLPEPLYCEIPDLLKTFYPNHRDDVIQLDKAVYGLQDAPQKWYIRFARDMNKIGAQTCPLDPVSYTHLTLPTKA